EEVSKSFGPPVAAGSPDESEKVCHVQSKHGRHDNERGGRKGDKQRTRKRRNEEGGGKNRDDDSRECYGPVSRPHDRAVRQHADRLIIGIRLRKGCRLVALHRHPSPHVRSSCSTASRSASGGGRTAV